MAPFEQRLTLEIDGCLLTAASTSTWAAVLSSAPTHEYTQAKTNRAPGEACPPTAVSFYPEKLGEFSVIDSMGQVLLNQCQQPGARAQREGMEVERREQSKWNNRPEKMMNLSGKGMVLTLKLQS
ncbi:unnamed protein product [Pleuronectes platessa]|uniref:Uncharacterized protein n=1 Tax=Pleuronectes platessa TaxID=8262 RepID=A0A9N7UVX8_PLEPL|nr:unnamed protein product [Pleuronectes platessa]